MELILNQNKILKIDDKDIHLLSGFTVTAVRGGYYSRWYVRCYQSDWSIFIHRLIINPPVDLFIDHINGDGLDNRRSNLRVVTCQQNHFNRKPVKNSSSKYKGVSFDKERNSWHASIKHNYKNIYLGRYPIEEEAALAYDKKAIELFGEYARLNFPERMG